MSLHDQQSDLESNIKVLINVVLIRPIRAAIKNDDYKNIDIDKLSKFPKFAMILKTIKTIQQQVPPNLLETLRLKRKLRFELNCLQNPLAPQIKGKFTFIYTQISEFF